MLAEDVASKFLRLSISESNFITPMKLQKLMYFAYGVYIRDSPESKALFDEKFRAWKYGPVLRSIYHKFKLFGNSNIKDYLPLIKLAESGFIFEEDIPDPRALKVIESTWFQLKDYDAMTLSNWTHTTDSPWYEVFKKKEDAEIPPEIIKAYFIDLK